MEKWTQISTNALTKGKSNKKDIDSIMNKSRKLNLKELKEIGDLHYEENSRYVNQLIDAYEKNKLKSKNLIKKAKNLKAYKDKADKIAATK